MKNAIFCLALSVAGNVVAPKPQPHDKQPKIGTALREYQQTQPIHYVVICDARAKDWDRKNFSIVIVGDMSGDVRQGYKFECKDGKFFPPSEIWPIRPQPK